MTAMEVSASPAAPTGRASGSAQGTVRRLIVSTILFALVTIAAIGVAGLLERLLGFGSPFVSGGTADLARSLAFALIGGPLAAVLWWAVWRRLRDESERTSLAWGLYVAAMCTVALIVATSALVGTATALVDDRWQPGTFATGAVWALVWVWHRWMWRHPVKRPVRLRTVPAVIGTAFGLIIGVGGAVYALGALFDTAIRGAFEPAIAGGPWWHAPVDGAIWAVAGAVIWWWHWYREGAAHVHTRFAAVGVVVVGVGGGAVLMLAGLGTALWVGLRLAFDPSESAGEVLRPLGTALASALVGAAVWTYHHHVATHRDCTRRPSTLVMSGVGLIAAASGIGVVVSAALAALVSPLAASDSRSLLLGGISALVVGGPAWWLSWKPVARTEPAEIAYPGRRVYLIAVFGVSAVVALVALLVVGFRVFEFGLDANTGESLIDRVRGPLGVLVAAALVFGYHFTVWRHDRVIIAAEGLSSERRIGRVFLVAAGEVGTLERAIADATRASVTVWQRAVAEPGAEPGTGPDAAAVAAALEGVTGRRVLVLVGPADRVEVVPLAD